jgi:hypothetical protein
MLRKIKINLFNKSLPPEMVTRRSKPVCVIGMSKPESGKAYIFRI